MTEARGLSFGNKPSETTTTEFANNRAYLVGINAYQNGIPPLRTAVADAERLAQLLEESHGYKTLAYPRDGTPSLASLRILLRETMPQEVGPDDRVLLYFAGHGIALDGEDGPEGYLVPEDASREERASFLPMTELNEALAELPCRHLLLILDCCFAGAFRWSSTRDLSALPSVIHRERYERYIQDPAWQVLTSAAYDQKAIDVLSGNTIGERIETAEHSPFAAALFRALAGDADLIPRGKEGQPDGDGVITATELYLYLRECVETATEEQKTRQTPGLWPLKKHDKGEYILLTPGHELKLPPAPELNYANNPYRGLQSFEEEHSQLFFGRTRVIEELHSHVSKRPLTIVLGASGTGKSSVVKAGLLPHVRTVEDWHILPVIRPGKSPLATLASLSLPLEVPNADETSRLAQLWSDENAFAQRIQEWAAAQPAASGLLLLVDQFEELVTLCWDGWERDRFIELLALAVRAVPERFRLLVTLRSDFEPQFSDCALKDQWMASRYVVPPMSMDDLREAIEGPASVRVLYFQPPELVDRLIDEVIQTPGAMPLLSFTLSELYVRYLERRGDDRCLALEDYERLGGVAGSLRSRATELYDKLDAPHQATMQRLMLRMVSAQGGELARRRVPKTELVFPSKEENERVSTVLNHLSEGRLIVQGSEVDGDPYVEPAHDALVRGWDKLLGWTRSEQEELMLRRLLTPAANDWQRHQGGTWHANPRLSLLNRIRRSEGSWLNQTETRFIARSVKKRRTIFFGATAFVLAAFITLAGLTYFALGQRDQALQRERESIRETARLFKNEGEQAQADGRLQSAMQYFSASLERRAAIDETDDICRLRLGVLEARMPVLRSIAKCPERPERVMLGPKGQSLLTFSDMETETIDGSGARVRLWDARTGRLVAFLEDGEQQRVQTASFSSDGKRLLVLFHFDNRATVWDTEFGNLLRRFEGHSDAVSDAVFGPGDQVIATSSHDGSVRIWDTETGKELQRLNAPEGIVNSVRFSPDRDKLAVACTGELRIWDVSTWKLLHVLEAKGGAKGVEFSHDGTQVASEPITTFTGGPGGRMPDKNSYKSTVWNVEDGLPLHTFANVYDFDFLPSGGIYTAMVTRMLGRKSAFWDGQLWQLDGQKVQAVGEYEGSAIANSPESDYFLLINDSGLRIVDPKDGRIRHMIVNVSKAKVHPEGRLLLTDYTDNSARLWDGRSGLMVAAFEGHSGPVLDFDFDQEGRWITTASADDTIRVWQYLPTGELVLDGHSGQITFVKFFDNGRRAVTGSWYNGATVNESLLDGAIRSWDLTTGRMIAEVHDVENTIPDSNLHRVAFDEFNSLIYAYYDTGSDSLTRIIDASNGSILATLEDFHLLAYHPEAGLVFGSGPERIEARRIWSGQLLFSVDGHLPTSAPIRIYGDRMATIVEDPSDDERYDLQIWDVRDGTPLACIEDLWVEPYMSYEHVVMHPSGRSAVVLVDQGQKSQIVDMVKGIVTGSLSVPEFTLKGGFTTGKSVKWTAISSNARMLITVGNLTTVWDATTGKRLHELAGRYLGDDPSSKRIITAEDGQIYVWDTSDWSRLSVVRSANDPITAARVSSDGLQLVTGSAGGAVELWDLDSGAHLVRLGVLGDSISVVATDGRGLRVLAASDTGEAKAWTVIPASLPTEQLATWIAATSGIELVEEAERVEGLTLDAWTTRAQESRQRLYALLESGDVTARTTVAAALLKLVPSDADAMKALMQSLASEDDRLRAQAQVAMFIADPTSDGFRGVLTSQAEGECINDSIVAILSRMGAEALPIIDRLLFERDHFDSHFRANLLVSTKSAGSAAVNLLARAVVDNDPLVRVTAGNILAYLGPDAAPAIPAMTRSIGMDDRNARIAVVRSLGKLGSIALPELMKAVRESPQHFTRMHSIELIGELKLEAKEAIPLLIDVAIKEENLRLRAVDAIAAIDSVDLSDDDGFGPVSWDYSFEGTISLPILRNYLSSQDLGTRIETVQVVALLSQQYVGLLENPVYELIDLALTDNDERVRDEAALAAVVSGHDAHPDSSALASFVKLLKSPEGELRDRAAMAIYDVGPSLAPWSRELLEAEGSRSDEPSATYAGHAFTEMGVAALPYLRQCLNDESPLIRAQAAYEIGNLREDAVEATPELVKLLDDTSEKVRFNAAVALIDTDGSCEEVLDVLATIVIESDDAERRRWGASALDELAKSHGEIYGERISEILRQTLSDKDPNTRFEAAESLLAVGGSREDAIQTLLDLLLLQQHVSTEAAMALAELEDVKNRVAPAIRRALGDLTDEADPNLALNFVRSLKKCGAIDELIDTLDKDPLGSFAGPEAVGFIEELLPKNLDRIPNVVGLLSNKDEEVRAYGADILASLGPDAKTALTALQEATSDPSENVRSAAFEAVREIRATELLEADDEATQLEAAKALLQRGRASEGLVDVLAAIISDTSDPNSRIQAIKALEDVGEDHAVRAIRILTTCLKDGNPNVRYSAASGLLRLDAAADEATTTLIELLSCNVEQGRYAAFAAGRLAESEELAPAIIERIRTAADEFPDYGESFASALSKLKAISALVQMLDDPKHELNESTILLYIHFAFLEDPNVNKLTPFFEHTSTKRRRQGIELLERIEDSSEEQLEILRRLLMDDDQDVVIAAQRAILKIGGKSAVQRPPP